MGADAQFHNEISSLFYFTLIISHIIIMLNELLNAFQIYHFFLVFSPDGYNHIHNLCMRMASTF